MVMGSYFSIITLNVNGLHVPTKRQKTGGMDTKTRPLYMLSIRKRPQTQEHIQTESEGLEKDISCKWRPKKAGVAILISDKRGFEHPVSCIKPGLVICFIYNCYMFFLDWSFDHMECPLLSLFIDFISKSILSDMNIAIPAFFWSLFA